MFLFSRERSLSPSRIPVIPQAEAYRRNSTKPIQQTESPKTSPVKPKTDSKIPKTAPKNEKPQNKFSRKSSQSRINPRSLADSGFNSSYPSKRFFDYF